MGWAWRPSSLLYSRHNQPVLGNVRKRKLTREHLSHRLVTYILAAVDIAHFVTYQRKGIDIGCLRLPLFVLPIFHVRHSSGACHRNVPAVPSFDDTALVNAGFVSIAMARPKSARQARYEGDIIMLSCYNYRQIHGELYFMVLLTPFISHGLDLGYVDTQDLPQYPGTVQNNYSISMSMIDHITHQKNTIWLLGSLGQKIHKVPIVRQGDTRDTVGSQLTP